MVEGELVADLAGNDRHCAAGGDANFDHLSLDEGWQSVLGGKLVPVFLDELSSSGIAPSSFVH
jgi:hypothetical protein